MVDLQGQYEEIQREIDEAVLGCIRSAAFINGPAVKTFAGHLADYLCVKRVIPCANGTDALQIAMMALGLKPGDEVIIPAFTYVATTEVIGLLGLIPVMVDVDPQTFNITPDSIETAISSKTKAIVPVHLYGQCADMQPILSIAENHDLYIIEDTAQALGAVYTFSDGRHAKAGAMGNIGCTSFFPSKNLGCYGDGGALYSNDETHAVKARMIANHGQEEKYVHKLIGMNSRLDTMQAAILDIKLIHLDEYAASRQEAANYYDNAFSEMEEITIPFRASYSTHVFHQYTLQIGNGMRNNLKEYLFSKNIPSMVYYPIPLSDQEAYKNIPHRVVGDLRVTKQLCNSVLSLPMHTELKKDQLEYIVNTVRDFFK